MAAMARRWHIPFPLASDPGGEEILKPLGLWNEAERGGIGYPAILVFAPDGRETFRYRSRDFADRPDDEDLFGALGDLGLPPLDPPPPWEPDAAPEENPETFRTDAFGAYFRGARNICLALLMRLQGTDAVAELQKTATMASSFLDAWKQRREAAGA
jgi:hypothetical protein